jgi:hypothetical protein
MTQDSCIGTEFPGEVLAIQRLRSDNSVFNEICEDFEMMGQELAGFSKGERLRNPDIYLDLQESYQALHQELVAVLRGPISSTIAEQ